MGKAAEAMLEFEQLVEQQGKELAQLKKDFAEVVKRLDTLEKKPSPPPSAPPPSAPPPTTPPPAQEPPAPPTQRTRAQVTALVLAEFARQTTYVPGEQNKPPAERAAIQAWTDNVIQNMDGFKASEADIRAKLAPLIAADVQKFNWPKPEAMVITGSATLP